MPLPPDTIAAIAARLAEHAGLALPAWVIDARATARIAVAGCSPDDYAALIASPRGAGELAQLIEAVRVGESRLFRHRSQIDALTGVVAPALRARGRRAIRVWSAGCAAGEEPYTLAIVLSRALPDCALSIVASDVSAEALARAAAAQYPRAALDHVPERYRDGFIADGDTVRVAPEIVARVELERANLLDGAAPRGCDLVWCRNVLIYFTAEARRRAIEHLVAATAPGGFVFVGYSESLRDVAELEAVRAGDAVYYVRRAEPARSRPPTAPPPVAGAAPALRSRPPTAPAPVAPPAPLPAAVVVRSRGSAPRVSTDDRPRGLAPAELAIDRRAAPAGTGQDRTPPPELHRGAAPIAVSDDRTPPPIRVPAAPPDRDTLAVHGQPTAAELTAEISARLALPGLRRLTIDLDGAELLDDELVRVLRRARAAASTADVGLSVRATRAGVVRWIERHGLEDTGTVVASGERRGPARRP